MNKSFDIKKFCEVRPLSWSAISSFEYDKEQWYQNYILRVKVEPSKEMLFGSKIGRRIEKDPAFLPEIIRENTMEYSFRVVFNGIKMVGYADTFCSNTFRKLGEYKTGKKKWDQKRADEHGQIDMYLLMNYIMNKVLPEEVSIILYWLPTIETGSFDIEFINPFVVQPFITKRTLGQILQFGSRINRTTQEMQEYVRNHN